MTTEEEKQVKELTKLLPKIKEVIADHAGLLALAEIGKDEIMRVKWEQYFSDDGRDMSLKGRTACILAREISRKFYRHHGDLKKYPWGKEEMFNITKEDIINFFKDIVDPKPDSEEFRTLKTQGVLWHYKLLH